MALACRPCWAVQGQRWARLFGVHFNATDSEVEQVIEQSLDKETFRRREDTSPLQVLTTRREAVALYREIWRVTALFVWRDERGRFWRDVLRESARQEYESARFESDPEIINRLLVVGRDSVHQIAEKFLAKRQRIIEQETAAQDQGKGLPFRGGDG